MRARARRRALAALGPLRRPPARVVRRRRHALLGGALAAFAVGALLGSGAGDDPPPPRSLPAAPNGRAQLAAPAARAAVDRLSLERQVGKLVVLRFHGPVAPLYVRRILRNGWAAGAILFRDNVAAPAQLRGLTRALHVAGRAAGATPIVCADQEGGAIRIVGWAPPSSAPAGQRAGPDASAAGRALRALGVNVALAPVADVPSVPGAALASRAFSGDPARTAAAVAAAVRGWRAAGVAATVKHFPGLGGARVNTDQSPATIAGAPTAADLAPFRAAIAAGVPLVMVAHAVYPALDPQRPASQSRAVVEGLLRGRLAFRGVVMTDSIEAAAVRATGTAEQAAVRSIRAGDDIVLTTSQGSWVRAYRALLAEARASRAFRARVRASAARVLALQRSLAP